MSAAQILSAHEQGDLGNLSTEICIIGSGPGGAFPAVALAELGHQVLLIEAGPMADGGGATRLIRHLEVHSESNLPFAGTVQLGGSSNLWAGRLVSLEQIDFEERDWVSHSGWPIPHNALPYDRAFQLLSGLVDHSQTHSTLPQWLDEQFRREGIDSKRFWWAPQAFNTGRYLEDATSRLGSRLRILVDSPVSELQERNDGGGVDAAIVKLPGGGRCKVSAKTFVLAAGGIETPRILLSSRNTSNAGIGNGHDLVGRYLSTHPKADIATLTLSRRVATNHPLFTDTPNGGGRLRLALGFCAEAQRRASLLNHCIQLSPLLEYRVSRIFEAIRQSNAIKSPFIEKSRIARGLLPSLGLFAFEAIGRLARIQSRAKVFVIRGYLDQYPNPENRVQLSGVESDMGLPTSDISWTFTQSDRQSVIAFLKMLDEALQRQGVGTIDYAPLTAREDEWPLTGIHSHFMGTTRMGANERVGVVDMNCRVFGQSNLYVSGPSTFSTYGYANPFLTISALGLRLAQHIHERHGAAPIDL